MGAPSPDVMVSVSIITYNQIDFIRKAIDSALKQEVSFNYEIIIGDDSSTDGTREVLKEYKEKYPDKIHLILHPHRYGDIPGRTNNITNIYACRGKYIALLDGDDFWISKDKLKRQVAFLEANPEYTFSTHQSKPVIDGEITEDTESLDIDDKAQKTFTHDDILQTPWAFAATSTFLLRNNVIHEFPDWFWDIISADYAIMLLWSEKGKLIYFNNIFTGYRQHEESFMATEYYKIDNLEIKIKELQLYRKRFLPFHGRDKKRGLIKTLKIAQHINKQIATIKQRYLAQLYAKKKYPLFFKKLILHSFSNNSFFYFLKLKIKKFLSNNSN